MRPTLSFLPRFAPARLALLLGCWLGATGLAAGQTDSLSSIGRKFVRYGQQRPQEKLYLHLDRPVYTTGELMWLKVYAVEATTSQPLTLSSVAYVDVLDERNHAVLQGKIALSNAVGQGSFSLPGALPSGHYTVRAYTSWMKNFGPEGYFHQTITVLNTSVASGVSASRADSAQADAQFFPEGGYLVKGLRSKVGFKVTDRTGRGIAATGQVLNPAGKVVASFSTLRLGMGNFGLLPEAAGPYTAVLTLPTGQRLRRPLPTVREQGYVLRLDNQAATNQLTITLNSTSTQPGNVYLLAHSQQQVAAATQAVLVNGQAVFVVDKRQLRSGVAHFTVFNTAQQPLAERLFFVPPTRQLTITAQADKAGYALRDHVRLQVSSADQQTPLPASLSVAVYRLDSLNRTAPVALDHYLGLTSDLRGTVEDPGSYFAATGPAAAEAADNLMLTQGWSRFTWAEVLSPRPLEYLPEPHGPVVRGRVTQAATGRPRTGVLAYLSAPSRLTRLTNSLSNAEGLVQFEMTDFYGPQDVIVQTDARQDSTSRLELFDPFSARFAAAERRPLLLLPSLRAEYARRHVQTQVQRAYTGQFRNRFVLPATDSTAFFGQPDETYLLDKFTRFKVMEEVLREYVPGVVVRIRKDGFHLLVVDNVNKTVFSENPMVLLDGVPVFNLNRIMGMNPLKIQKLDVVDSRYFHGLAIYDGIVSFSTYKGNLEGFPLDPRVLVQQYEGLQRQREFYAPRYDTPAATQTRLPDLRNLLYWNPSVATTAAGPQPLDFYTGDQPGRYLVVVQGLAATGLAGSRSFVLDVKPAL